MIVTLSRVVKFAGQNFVRNAWLTAATITVLVLTIVSLNMLIVMNVLGNVALAAVKSKISVAVHFKPDVEDSRVQTVKIELLSMPEVKDVEYVSPTQAFSDFSAQYKGNDSVVESLGQVGTNPFGASLVVTARELSDYPRIVQALDDPRYAGLVDEKDFDDRQAVIGRVESISSRLEMSGVAMSAVFAVVALLIILNTIRVSIYTRKEEIGIMRLVGASDRFIRAPFYVEALFWTFASLGAALAILYPAMRLAQPFLQRFFGSGTVDLIGFYDANFFRVVGLQLFGVALMAVVTTKMATAKYLKV